MTERIVRLAKTFCSTHISLPEKHGSGTKATPPLLEPFREPQLPEYWT
jgi:hypothetical protein